MRSGNGSYLEAHNDVGGPVLALGHYVGHVELVGHLLTDVVHNCLDFLLPGGGGAASTTWTQEVWKKIAWYLTLSAAAQRRS